MRPGSLAERPRLSDLAVVSLLAVCLLLGGCGHSELVLPSVEVSTQPRISVVWQGHAYKGGGFHYVPVRTFLLGQADDPPTTLTPAAPEGTAVTVQPSRLSREIIVHFALNSAFLSDDARQALGSSLEQLKAARRVTVIGYTCSLGPQGLNDQLAQTRAETMAAFLKANGVPVVGVAGRGKCCYAAPNDTEETRARNRRVVVSYVLGE